MRNPIVERELIGTLRTRKALAFLVLMAAVFAVLVVMRWPTDSRVGLSGAQSQQVFRLFGYGLLAALILLVPGFPATSIVREKNQGTLELLLNSPMKPWSIYFGKLCGVFASQNWPGGGGASFTEMTMITGMLVRGMLIYSGGISEGKPYLHFGAVSSRAPDEDLYRERCLKLGENIARKAVELFGDA